MSYYDMINAVDSRLLPGKEAALYSTCNHGTTLEPAATYVRNPLFWAKDYDFSFHAIGEWLGHYWQWTNNAWVDILASRTPVWSNYYCASLITPRHVIVCAHAGRGGVWLGEGPDGLGRCPDATLRFLTADGQIEQRRAMAWAGDPLWYSTGGVRYDWQVGVLESDITTIKPVKFLPDDYLSHFPATVPLDNQYGNDDALSHTHVPLVWLTNRLDVENIHAWVAQSYTNGQYVDVYSDTPLPYYHSSSEARIADLNRFSGGANWESIAHGEVPPDESRASLTYRANLLVGDSGSPCVLLTPEGPVIVMVANGGGTGTGANLVARKAQINLNIRNLDIAVNGEWSGYEITQATLHNTVPTNYVVGTGRRSMLGYANIVVGGGCGVSLRG